MKNRNILMTTLLLCGTTAWAMDQQQAAAVAAPARNTSNNQDQYLEILRFELEQDTTNELALLTAAYKNDDEQLAALLKQERYANNVDKTNLLEQTALMWFAIHGNIKALSLLIQHKAQINKQTKTYGESALVNAITHNKPDAVRFILQNGALLAPTHLPCIAFTQKSLKTMLQALHDDPIRKLTLLESCIKIIQEEQQSKKLELATSIVMADHKEKYKDKLNPFALSQEKLRKIRKLIETEQTNCHKQITQTRQSLLRFLADNKAQPAQCQRLLASLQQPLIRAALENDWEVVQALLATGYKDFYGQDNQADTVVDKAAECRRHDIILQLMKAGHDINHIDKNGNTALHVAILSNCESGVQTLLDCGANLNAQNGGGHTPLHLAILHSYRGMCQQLIGKGARIDIPNKNDWTAVELSVECKQQGAKRTQLIVKNLSAPRNSRSIEQVADDINAIAQMLQQRCDALLKIVKNRSLTESKKESDKDQPQRTVAESEKAFALLMQEESKKSKKKKKNPNKKKQVASMAYHPASAAAAAAYCLPQPQQQAAFDLAQDEHKEPQTKPLTHAQLKQLAKKKQQDQERRERKQVVKLTLNDMISAIEKNYKKEETEQTELARLSHQATQQASEQLTVQLKEMAYRQADLRFNFKQRKSLKETFKAWRQHAYSKAVAEQQFDAPAQLDPIAAQQRADQYYTAFGHNPILPWQKPK